MSYTNGLLRLFYDMKSYKFMKYIRTSIKTVKILCEDKEFCISSHCVLCVMSGFESGENELFSTSVYGEE